MRAVLLGTPNLCPTCQNRRGQTLPCSSEEEEKYPQNTQLWAGETYSCPSCLSSSSLLLNLLHFATTVCQVRFLTFLEASELQLMGRQLWQYIAWIFFFAAHEAVVQDTMA